MAQKWLKISQKAYLFCKNMLKLFASKKFCDILILGEDVKCQCWI